MKTKFMQKSMFKASLLLLLLSFGQQAVYSSTHEEAPTESATDRHFEIKMKINNKDRVALVYAPEELPDNRPLLLMFHGMGMWHRGMPEPSQHHLVADTAKFVVVYPNGDGDLPWDVGGDSELAFITALIDKMHTDYKIDKKRVYASGFSWGGNFCYRLANRLSDKIAAIAPIMGWSWGPNPSVAQSTRPMPILQMVGIYDDLFKPYENDNIKNHLSKWLTRNGANRSINRGKVTNPYPEGSTGGAKKTYWVNPDTGIEVVLLETPNGHSIPMNKNHILSNIEVWNFCKRYSTDGLIDAPSSIENETNADNATVMKEEFYTVTGQRINSPADSTDRIAIAKKTFSNGAVETEKYIK